jgi:hypothetical protein
MYAIPQLSYENSSFIGFRKYGYQLKRLRIIYENYLCIFVGSGPSLGFQLIGVTCLGRKGTEYFQGKDHLSILPTTTPLVVLPQDSTAPLNVTNYLAETILSGTEFWIDVGC